MHLECCIALPLLGVDLVFEVVHEFLQVVDGVAITDIRDVDRGFEDARHLALVLHFLDATTNHLCDFGAHDLWYLAPVFPKDISDALLPQLSVDAHVKLEVLVDE